MHAARSPPAPPSVRTSATSASNAPSSSPSSADASVVPGYGDADACPDAAADGGAPAEVLLDPSAGSAPEGWGSSPCTTSSLARAAVTSERPGAETPFVREIRLAGAPSAGRRTVQPG